MHIAGFIGTTVSHNNKTYDIKLAVLYDIKPAIRGANSGSSSSDFWSRRGAGARSGAILRTKFLFRSSKLNIKNDKYIIVSYF